MEITEAQKKEAYYRAAYKPMPKEIDWSDWREAVELCGGLHFPVGNARTALIKLLSESDPACPFDFDFELLEVLCLWRRRKREIDALLIPSSVG